MGHTPLRATRVVVRTRGRQPLTVLVDEPIEIGRECDGLLVADGRVSRRHLAVEAAPDGQLKVTDLGSSNGSFVNGEKLTTTTLLEPGQSVVIGDTTVEVGRSIDDLRGIDSSMRLTQIDTRPTDDLLKTSIDLVADSVSGDLSPELVGVEAEAGTLTIAFSDIEESTAQALRLGDRKWLEVLTGHQRLVETHVLAHQGRVIKHQGDGFMLSFRSARQAVLASIGLQRDLHRLALAETGEEVRVRIGMHTGEVLMDDDGDLFGKHVVVAARVGALASGGSILATSLVKQITEPRGDLVFRDPVEVELKGITHAVTVHEVDWERSLPRSTAQSV